MSNILLSCQYLPSREFASFQMSHKHKYIYCLRVTDRDWIFLKSQTVNTEILERSKIFHESSKKSLALTEVPPYFDPTTSMENYSHVQMCHHSDMYPQLWKYGQIKKEWPQKGPKRRIGGKKLICGNAVSLLASRSLACHWRSNRGRRQPPLHLPLL